MKISTIRSQIVALPNDEPLAGFSENPDATKSADHFARNVRVSIDRDRVQTRVQKFAQRPLENGQLAPT